MPAFKKPTPKRPTIIKKLRRLRQRTLTFSIDTETTGVDLYHGAKPFFVTTCQPDGTQKFWEWDVDPVTRQPLIPQGDIEEINQLLEEVKELVLQNAKFDVAALDTIGVDATAWPWDQTFDTLIASHLLASNLPHDLTSMAMQYLNVDIEPYETKMKEAVLAARSLVRREFPTWRIAQEGLDDMPSAKETVWKYDCWLPRAVAKQLNYPDAHPWWSVTASYANVDSAVTMGLRDVLQEEITKRGLNKIWSERMKIPRIAYGMERRGITLNKNRLDQLTEEFKAESEERKQVCVNLAKTFDYDLALPKGGTNKSLTSFVFDVMKFPVVSKTKKGGQPSLDKRAMSIYKETMPTHSKELAFVHNLLEARARDTSISYMNSYRKFWHAWIPVDVDPVTGAGWYVLHPSLNPTGTNTLRWSSSNPNEQNISKLGRYEGDSKTLRWLFGPAPGREWWSCDAKNIELRLPAYESLEQELIALFEQPNEPPYYGSTHLLNFHTVYPDIWNRALKGAKWEWEGKNQGKYIDETLVGPYCKKKYADSWYQWVKNGGFAVQYGAIDKEDGTGTADKAFHKPGAHALLKARFNKLEQLNQKCIDHANRYGYVETMPDKSVDPTRGYPLYCTRSEWGKILPTVPLNYHVQGTAMWWMGRAMVRCEAYLEELNRECGRPGHYAIAMQVHDELVFDFPKGTGDEPWKTNYDKIQHLRALMSQGGDDVGVPTPTSCEYHAVSWSEGKSV